MCVQQHIKSSSFTITTQSNTSSNRSQRRRRTKRIQNERPKKMDGINRATNEEEADDGVQHHQSVQPGIAPGGATWTGENRSVETEKVLARGVRSIRVVLRVLEIWSVTVGNETDERCKDFTKHQWRAGNVRGITRHRRTRNDCIRDELRGELARFYCSHGQGSISETTINDAGKNARFHRRGRVGAERKVFAVIRNRQFRRTKLRDGEVEMTVGGHAHEQDTDTITSTNSTSTRESKQHVCARAVIGFKKIGAVRSIRDASPPPLSLSLHFKLLYSYTHTHTHTHIRVCTYIYSIVHFFSSSSSRPNRRTRQRRYSVGTLRQKEAKTSRM